MPLKKSSLAPSPLPILTQDVDAAFEIARLSSIEPEARREAAGRLSGNAEAASALGRRFAIEGDESVREALSLALIAIGGNAVVVEILPLLASDDAGLRNATIAILQALPQDVAPHMQALLTDPDSDTRIFALNIIEALHLADVEAWLIAVLERDSEVNVVGTALDILAEVATMQACAAIEAVRARFAGEPFIAYAAGKALKHAGAGL